MSNGWVDINQYDGPAGAYANEQNFAWHPGPGSQPLTQKGLPAPAAPGIPGHYVTGDYEATLRNQGFTPAQAAVLSALNTWRWRQLGAQQAAGTPATASPVGGSVGPTGGTAPADSLGGLPTDPRGYAGAAVRSYPGGSGAPGSPVGQPHHQYFHPWLDPGPVHAPPPVPGGPIPPVHPFVKHIYDNLIR